VFKDVTIKYRHVLAARSESGRELRDVERGPIRLTKRHHGNGPTIRDRCHDWRGKRVEKLALVLAVPSLQRREANRRATYNRADVAIIPDTMVVSLSNH
jgi:hypothetical protein